MRDSSIKFLKSNGNFYSWHSSKMNNCILSRIDHYVCNGHWQDKYEGSIVNYHGLSDHTPMLATVEEG